MLPVRTDLELWTNGDFREEWWIADSGASVDLTDYSFDMQIKSTPHAASALLTLATVNDDDVPGVYIFDPAEDGQIQVYIPKESIATLYDAVNPSLFIGTRVSLPYDILVTSPSGDVEPWFYGYIQINKGITNG